MSDSLSNQPPQFVPQPGATPPRPTSVTVFGILNLMFAGLGLFGLCFTLIPLMGVEMPNQPPNPVFEILRENQAYYAYMIVSMALGFVAIGVLGLAGYGLLTMRPWGRKLSIIYAVYAIVAGVAGMIANWVWLVGPLLEKANAAGPGPEQAGAIGGLIGGVFGGCFGMIYPIVLLIFMKRRNVVEAFQARRT